MFKFFSRKKIIFLFFSLALSANFSNAMERPNNSIPRPFVNSDKFYGGICYANAVLQSLFQISGFKNTVDSNVAISGVCQILKAIDNNILHSVRQENPCAVELVKELKNKFPGGDFDGSNLFFIICLLENLLQDMKRPGISCYGYFAERYNVNSKVCLRTIPDISKINNGVNIKWNMQGQPLFRGRNLDLFNFNAYLIVVPILNLVIVQPADLACEVDIEKLGIIHQSNALQILLKNGKNSNSKFSLKLKGLNIDMKSNRGLGHTLAYVNNGDRWFLCDDADSLGVRDAGNSLSDVSKHITSSLPSLVSRYKVSKINQTPSLLFYEINDSKAQDTSSSSNSVIGDNELQRVLALSRNKHVLSIPNEDESVQRAIELSFKEQKSGRQKNADQFERDQLRRVMQKSMLESERRKQVELYEQQQIDLAIEKSKKDPIISESGNSFSQLPRYNDRAFEAKVNPIVKKIKFVEDIKEKLNEVFFYDESLLYPLESELYKINGSVDLNDGSLTFTGQELVMQFLNKNRNKLIEKA